MSRYLGGKLSGFSKYFSQVHSGVRQRGQTICELRRITFCFKNCLDGASCTHGDYEPLYNPPGCLSEENKGSWGVVVMYACCLYPCVCVLELLLVKDVLHHVMCVSSVMVWVVFLCLGLEFLVFLYLLLELLFLFLLSWIFQIILCLIIVFLASIVSLLTLLVFFISFCLWVYVCFPCATCFYRLYCF